MPQPSDSDTPLSDYPELVIPPDGWKSNIPEHLLRDASAADRWLMEEMSKNTQATEFCVHAAVNTNDQVRRTNGRLKGAERNIIGLQQDLQEMKVQMRAMKPIIGPLSTIRVVFSYKIAWAVLGIVILFLAGANRDVLFKIAKYFLEP